MEKIVFTKGEKRTLIIAGVGVAALGYVTGRFVIEPPVKKLYSAIVNTASASKPSEEKETEKPEEKENNNE